MSASLTPAENQVFLGLYKMCREMAVEKGMTKEEFDAREKRMFGTRENIFHVMRVLMMSPQEKTKAVHAHFALISLVDSAIQRQSMLAETAQLYLLDPKVLIEEWNRWNEKNSSKSGDQLVNEFYKPLIA